ncbi:MAG: hypothetical protein HY710_15050 [Candidatus Latescibacteria bacterium]|nr:hypothetical protein [Candidatus Latescibacterota bacterium]
MDAGDLFGVSSNPVKDRYVTQAMGRLAYDAINVGDQDCVDGVAFLLEQAQAASLPLVSATVTAASHDDWGAAVLPWRLVRVGRLRVGLLGITPDKAFRFLDPAIRAGLTIAPADTVLTRQVRLLRKQCDLLVVLSHAGFEADQGLAQTVPGIDVIVGGHSQTFVKDPVLVGQTLIVQAGKNGEHLGMLTLSLKGRHIREFANTLIPLDNRVAPDPDLDRLVAEYIGLLKTRQRQKQVESSRSPRLKAADCTPCHRPQAAQWDTTPHRHAFETLVRAGKQDNPECLSCHVTLAEAEHEGIQCLSCHVVTADHGQPNGVTTVPRVTAAQCRTCHDPIQNPDFHYEDMVKKVVH